jgi:hypothetical protein
MRNPLTIKLSLFAISAEAVKAFQEICRDIIFFAERRAQQEASIPGQPADLSAKQKANINAALDLVLHADGKDGHVTDKEVQRLHAHILTLQNARVPLKRVILQEE